jgi:hypothetical protein
MDQLDLSLARCMAADMVTKRIIIPRRDPKTPATAIDLSDDFNTTLGEAWPGQEPLRLLAALAPGLARIAGVEFDARGAIQLRAMRPGLVPYPAAVTNISLDQAGRGVHLLVGTVHPAAPGTVVMECVFHLADGRQQRLSLEYERHVAVCLEAADNRSEPVAGAQAAWSSVAEDGQRSRLYHCHWTNPFPDQVIQRLEFIAGHGDAGPFLVALSIEPAL